MNNYIPVSYTHLDVYKRQIEHIRGQESDRINGMLTELRRMGIEADELDGGIRIKPGIPKPCKIETYEDHRMAMAFSLPGLIAVSYTHLDVYKRQIKR